MSRILLLNKPFNVLCQFTDNEDRRTLAEFINEKGLYPAGRLDRDSEGLVLLTDDGRLQHCIAHPRHKMEKTYWVQLEGVADEQSVQALLKGIQLKDGPARALSVSIIDEPPLWPRNPPIRYRASIPTSWLALTINEGRNRQVRRMTAAVGLPTLRLIRSAIGSWELEELEPGQWRELSEETVSEFKQRCSNLPTHRKRSNAVKRANNRRAGDTGKPRKKSLR